ncbi:MAG: BLUF domain-containing protein [Proteobacteria bacterium]|nr:BLUF domain-containing protein [Pseudomonadota bacterium]
MSVFTIAYHSRNLIEEQTLDSTAEVQRLLEQSRARNERLGITGALLFNEGRFVQVLEGDEAAVLEVMDIIRRDPRHTDIDVLPSRYVRERTFAQWSMAFVGVSPQAKNYYRDFSLREKLEWTSSTTDLLAALILDLIMVQGAVVPRRPRAQHHGR